MGSGFNFFSFFDNLNGWNRDWSEPGVDGSIYVNDVVVSRARIGHSYRVGDDSSQPPPRPDVVPIDKLVPALRLDHPATKSARFGSSNAFKA